MKTLKRIYQSTWFVGVTTGLMIPSGFVLGLWVGSLI